MHSLLLILPARSFPESVLVSVPCNPGYSFVSLILEL